MKSLRFISKILTVFFISEISLAGSGITYHGKILMPDGTTPVTSSTTQFRIQVRTPGTENCLLWEEQQTKDLSSSNGVFTITIADTNEPTLIANTLPFSLERIFSNRTGFTGLTNCSSGTIYTPSSAVDGRNLQVYFREIPSAPWEQMPLTKVNFVPLALNSVQLAGYQASEFLKIDPASSYTTLTAANVNTLVDIIAGTNAQYLRPATTFGGDVTGTYNATVVEKIRGTSVVATAPTNGQVLKFNGTNWAPAADDSGSSPGDATYVAKGLVQIDTDLATSGLQLTTGVLSLPNTITAGTAVGSASSIPVLTYDAKGRLTTVTPTTVNDTTKLPLAGGTMTGPINMGTQNITNATTISATNLSATNFSGRNLILNDNDNSNTATIRAPTDVTSTYTLTLPPAGPAAGQILSSDASGNLSWTAASSGSVTSITSTNNYITVAGTASIPTLTANVGTAVNTLAAGDDARIVGAVQQTAYSADLAPVATCTGTQKPSWNTVSDLWECVSISGFVTTATGFVQDGNSFAAAATVGTNDNNNLNFETNGTTKMSILADGKVGIGNSSPGFLFDVNLGHSNNARFQSAGAYNNNFVASAFGNFLLSNNVSYDGTNFRYEKSGNAAQMQLEGTTGNIYLNTFASGTAGTIATPVKSLTVLADGKVGLGSTAPTHRLSFGAATNGSIGMDTAAAGIGGQYLTISAGANGGGTDLNGGDLFLSSGSSTGTGAASIFFRTPTPGSTGTTGNFSTTKMTLNGAGNLGIGVTPGSILDIGGAFTQRGISAATAGLSPAGEGRMYFDSTSNTFKISQNGGAYADILTSASGAGDITDVVAGTGLTGGATSGSATLNVDVGITNGKIVQVQTGGKLPVLDGSDLTNLDAGDIATGTLAVARGGTGQTSYVDGQLLIGNSTGNTLTKATLTAGTGISITNGSGAITINNSLGTNIDLATEVTGVLPIANGGTNSSTALTNGKVMVSSAGTIIEGNASNTAKSNNTFVMRDGSGNIAGALGTFDQFALNGSTAGTLNIYAPASFTTWSLTLPTTAGTNGQVLTTNGSGVTSWATALTSTTGFMQDGNSFSATATLGTNDNNALGFETNGTTKMTILANGNVGIGTSSPTAPLNVLNNPGLGSGGHDLAVFDRVAGNDGVRLGYVADGAAVNFSYVRSDNGQPLKLGTSSTYAGAGGITIIDSGNVGIGITAPTTPLHVVGNSQFVTTSTATSGAIYPNDFSTTLQPSGASTLQAFTTRNSLTYNSANNVTSGGWLTPSMDVIDTQGAGTIDKTVGHLVRQSSIGGNVTASIGYEASIGALGASTQIGSYGGFYIPNLNAVSNIGNVQQFYGFRTEDFTAATATVGFYSGINSGTSKYAFYGAGTAPSFFTGNIGIGSGATIPSSALDMNGAMTQRGIAAATAGLSPAGQGRMYFDSSSNTFKISQNGAAYADILTSASGVGDITDVVAGTGLTGGATSGSATLNVDVGITNGKIVQVQTGGKLPVLDGSDLTNLDAGDIATGTLLVARGGTGLAAGISGGIPYYNSTSTMASSGALAANGVLLGGGAGSAPTATIAGTANQVLRVPAGGGAPAFGTIDISAAVTGVLPIASGGTNSSTALTNGKVMVSSAGTIIEGNASNTAKSNNTFVMRDGSGNIAGALGTFDQFALNGSVAGTVNIYAPSSFTTWSLTLPTTAGTSGQLLSTNGSGVTSWATALTSATAFVQDGNSFSGTATLGTNDNNALGFETNGTTKMTVLANGNVGIATASPQSKLHVLGNIQAENGGIDGLGTQMVFSPVGFPSTFKHIISSSHSNTLNTNNGIKFSLSNTAGSGTIDVLSLIGDGTVSMGKQALTGSTSGTLSIIAPASFTDWSWTYPTSGGTSGQVLSTNGSGVTSWVTAPVNGGTFLAANGSAGTPSISFSSNTNTGFYRSASNEISMAINGAQTAFFNSTAASFQTRISNFVYGGTTYSPTGGSANPSTVGISTANTNSLDSSYVTSVMTARNTGGIDQSSYMATVANNSGQTPTVVFGQQTAGSAYTERMRIGSAGNLGIGTTNVTTPRLAVGQDSSTTNLSLSNTSAIEIININGNSDTGGQINFRSDSNTGSAGIGAVIGFLTKSSSSAGSNGDIVFGVKTNISDTSVVQAMTVERTGNVKIGKTTAASARLDIVDTSTTTSGVILPRAATFTGTNVDGMLRYNTSTNLFEFRQNGAWVNYTTVSDGRLKTNVKTVENGLDLVNKLNPVFYDWDHNNPRTETFGDKREVGFIAQEVEKVLPEVVNEGADTYRSLEYGKVVSVVVAAVKELYIKVVGIDRDLASVKVENAKLKVEVEKQKQENAAIKAYLCSRDPKAVICK